MANAAGDRSAEDLTARARIRDAALRLFAERGLDGTTIRDIAKEAGVSGGLIRHHFGSKDDLRAACDRYALDQIMRIKEQAVLDGQLGNPAFMSAAPFWKNDGNCCAIWLPAAGSGVTPAFLAARCSSTCRIWFCNTWRR